MSSNVLPSAPELYPMQELAQAAANGDDFRLKKVNDLLKELTDEIEHYRLVAKKYKRAHSMVHYSAVGFGAASVGLSSGALASALTGFGIVASPALAGVATVCGLSSIGFSAVSKRLERKLTKHEKIYTLALSKRNSIYELVSKALADKHISDAEFSIITREVEKYHQLKGAIRDGVKQSSKTPAEQSETRNAEGVQALIHKEVEQELQKKLSRLIAPSKSDLKD